MSARSIRRSRIVGSTVAAIVALTAALGGAAPAGAVQPAPVAKYVALGDSYAAGQGAAAPLDSCLRSNAAYPVLLDAEPRTNLLRFPACSGDGIAEVAATQLSQVNRGTTLVTLTVGANDLGAGAAYAACVPDPTSFACAAALATVQQVLQSGAIATGVGGLVAAIAERAPNAHIVVTDYPIPFKPALQPPITDAVNAAIVQLDTQIAQAVAAAAAAGADVELASVALAFVGHQIGDPTPWLGADSTNPITFLHPTADGQAVYRAAVLTALAS
ncbi:GDSL-type esterase/lipase family protein [Agromyces sp. NPDC056523]|uniref:GDSL-type esterase/lipase family protein n=1 Tax=Agromyces sp. NPDC056523 TaxID=3345850 RepID=UPI0036711D7B